MAVKKETKEKKNEEMSETVKVTEHKQKSKISDKKK